jgi:hypothetical protein
MSFPRDMGDIFMYINLPGSINVDSPALDFFTLSVNIACRQLR